MGVKVTLIALPSDSVELIFAVFPTSAILTEAVATDCESHFGDLVENLETAELTELEEDFNSSGYLALDSTIEDERTGMAIFEVITIY